MNKQEILARYLDCDLDDVTDSSWDPDVLDTPEGDYLVLTDKEADDRAREQILEQAWAFRAEFLADYTPEGIEAEVLEAIQGNDAFLALIKAGRGLDAFVEGAIGADGRGHFLASYDHEENESEGLYIYKQG